MIPKVSVIVLVYNVANYIERCVRNLMEQTLDEIEFIFVNDCTPDNSMELLKRVITDYPQRSDYVKVINHVKNLGSSAARNTGLEHATGKYVIYCDSDDWVEKNMYEEMYNKAQEGNADIVVTDFYNEYLSHSIIQKQPCPIDRLEVIRQMLSGNLHCGTWNKLIRRELYLKNNIHFPDGINMWEDVLTVIPLCYHASKVVYIPKAYYHYVHYNPHSYITSMNYKSLQDMISAVECMDTFLVEHGLQCMNVEFCNMKLTAKLNLLIGVRGFQQKKWNQLYKETNSYIFSAHNISIYWRIALKFASLNLLSLFNGMVFVGGVLKKCKK